jgi:hypothetical protein
MSILDQIQDHRCFGDAQDVTKGEIKDVYHIMLDDSYANCQTCIEDKYPQNGIGIPWRIHGGQ